MLVAESSKKRILIVDRDVVTVEPLRQKLCEAGFAVRAIADGAAATTTLAQRPPHLMIIDWNMPGFAALELIRTLRRTRTQQAIRLMILSALIEEQDIVAGLELGADDYIAKPFSLREVVTRCGVLLRSRCIEEQALSLTCGDLVLNTVTGRVTARGRILALRGIEFRLLEYFMAHPGSTFSRAHLLAQVWGDDSEVDERTVDVNVQRLRKILSQQGFDPYIQTIRGFGYRFSPPHGSPSAPDRPPS